MNKCLQCHEIYHITPEEVSWYVQQFGEGGIPKRCPACRRKNKKENRKRTLTELKKTNARLLKELITAKKDLEEKNVIFG